MDYFVPAWHGQLGDWSFSAPSIQFDDAISHIQVLQNDHRQVGLVVTDYQPQLSTKLSQMALSPTNLFSVYDYLQGIITTDNQVVDYRDLNWPADATFDFTNFHLLVISHGQHYATVVFDIQGKILNIYFNAGPDAGTTLLFDSRGFVSQSIKGNVATYYDQQGNWRFQHNQQTDQVTINAALPRFSRQIHYDHLTDLLAETVHDQLAQRLSSTDQLIVTVDNTSVVPQNIYTDFSPLYSVSRWHTYNQALTQIKPQQVLVDSKETADAVHRLLGDQVKTLIIPLFQSQFKLGHSQRILQQRIGVFAENMTAKELNQILEIIYPRLLKKPKDEALYLFTYSSEKARMVGSVFEKFRQRHKGEFILSQDEIDPGENQIEDFVHPPLLTIKQQRFITNHDVMTALDQIRIMINWHRPDQFMTMAAISIGIPQLQNFQSEGVVDHHNGIICHNYDELKAGIAYYLDTLKHWNESLVYSVQLLNRYSQENLLHRWDQEVEKKGTK